jgi:hypothetical protein
MKESKKLGTFREWLNEERKSNEYGLDVSGHLLDLSIKMQKNKLIEISVQGKKTLVKLKSVETLKREYAEENHKEIEKIWKNLAERESVKIEKLVQKFEDDLNSIIVEMEKEIAELD